MISEKEEAFFILLFWKVGPSYDHKVFWNVCFIFTRLYDKFQCLKILRSYSKNLQNKKKYEKSPKKEEGGDDKHVYFFIRPYIAKNWDQTFSIQSM